MAIPPSGIEWGHLGRWKTVTITVTEEEDALAEPFSTIRGLDPLASSSTRPESLNESPGTAFDIGAVMTTQYRLDGFGSLVSVIERDGGDKVVKDVSLYNAVHQGSTDEAKFSIHGCSSTASEVPSCVLIMRERGIGMLEKGDCNCSRREQSSDGGLKG